MGFLLVIEYAILIHSGAGLLKRRDERQDCPSARAIMEILTIFWMN